MRNKVAIVTGGSRGIGRAIAFCFANDGMNIVVNGRKESEVRKTVTQIERSTGVKAISVTADIRYHKEVSRLIKTAVKEFKQVDVLVNNAGIAVVKPLVETSDEEWNMVMDTNLKGVFFCCREVLPYMISQRSGSIINISSGAGKSGFADLSAYCASKFGVIGLTESLAREVSRHGINVIAICPGAVATQMQREFMSEEEYKKGKRKMIQPEEVAKKVLQAVRGKFRSGSAIDVY